MPGQTLTQRQRDVCQERVMESDKQVLKDIGLSMIWVIVDTGGSFSVPIGLDSQTHVYDFYEDVGIYLISIVNSALENCQYLKGVRDSDYI